MNSDWEFADDLGPEKIIYLHNASAGLKAILVVDNVACGPSIGGSRMAPDVSVEECCRLARAMTMKNAAAGLPHGGGKSAIFADPKMPATDKERLMRAFARGIADTGDYIVGPDMGTNETCMAWIQDEIGRADGRSGCRRRSAVSPSMRSAPPVSALRCAPRRHSNSATSSSPAPASWCKVSAPSASTPHDF